MRYATVCSGIEAPSVAVEPLGWTPVFFSDIEPFPCDFLAERFPHVPNLGDMTLIDGRQWRGKVDVLIGGTPCQAFSMAGKRRSLDDARGNLTLSFVELCDAIDPHAVLWENVPGVLNTKDNAFGCFLAALVGADFPLVPPRGRRWTRSGLVAGPKRRVAWRTLDAQWFGVAQRRRRVLVVALRAGDDADPCAVLLEPGSLPRRDPPSREGGQDAARDPDGRPHAASWDGGQLAGALTVSGLEKQQLAPHRDLMAAVVEPIAVNARQWPVTAEGVSLPLDTQYNTIAVTEALSVALRGREGGATLELGDDIAGCLRASQGGGDKPHVLVRLVEWAIRRLTPLECERLQGFPDFWTLITRRGKPAADGPRYRALGNSMAVPVIRWICERIPPPPC